MLLWQADFIDEDLRIHDYFVVKVANMDLKNVDTMEVAEVLHRNSLWTAWTSCINYSIDRFLLKKLR